MRLRVLRSMHSICLQRRSALRSNAPLRASATATRSLRRLTVGSAAGSRAMRVVVHSAAIQDRDGAGLVLDKIRRRFPWLVLMWADGGYSAWQVDAAVAKVPPLRLEIVKRSDDVKGFVVLPRRWVVERTFSWFGRNRRLAKDFENLAETLTNFVTLASIQLALRRLARM